MGFACAKSETKTISIKGPNGNIVADVSIPENIKGKKLPIAIIMHGFTSNRNEKLIQSLFDELTANGICAVKFDFDGHGDSGGAFSDMTVPKEIDDALTIYDTFSKFTWVSEIYFIGHSQGGVVASMAAGKLGSDKVAGLCLLAPAAVLRDDALRGQIMGQKYDAQNPPEYIPIFKGLKLGREYVLTAQTLPIYDTSRLYQGPALMLHGTSDIVVPYTYSLRYNENYHNGSLMLVKGLDHSFTGHEQAVAKIVADYLKSTVKDYVL